ncbi:MAG TPA: molecular chaperone TorD family protein [Micromonosporaceae bacterium]|nr:molecular chaperone TorD family protein [Micromonosporaceae bacterium]
MTATAVVETPARARDRAELLRALGVQAEPPGPAQDRLADLLGLPRPTGADWTEAFMVQLVPYASVYLGAEGMLGGEAADRVAGFWRALRLPVPAEPDHVATLLGLYASLIEAEPDAPAGPQAALLRQARTALLHEHLTSWLPAYAHAMADSGPPPYAAWAHLLRETLLAEAAHLGVPQRLPAHLRAVPPVAADGGRADLLDGLLAPARSGIVLSRAHLAAAARHTGLGLRLGGRRAVLRALVEQDPAAALQALADQARGWLDRHRADEPVVGPAAGHWAARASATADLLATAGHTANPPTAASAGPPDERPPVAGPGAEPGAEPEEPS